MEGSEEEEEEVKRTIFVLTFSQLSGVKGGKTMNFVDFLVRKNKFL